MISTTYQAAYLMKFSKEMCI